MVREEKLVIEFLVKFLCFDDLVFLENDVFEIKKKRSFFGFGFFFDRFLVGFVEYRGK